MIAQGFTRRKETRIEISWRNISITLKPLNERNRLITSFALSLGAPVSIIVGILDAMIRTLVTVMSLSLPCFGQTRAFINTSICAIAAHPSKFHNKNVRIRGTALSGMEASILIDSRDGEWQKQCGRINLDFHSTGTDESTERFLKLFDEQVSPPECNKDEEITKAMAHFLDPSAPPPTPCFPIVSVVCIHCPRYSIVGTFTGKLRYSEMERGHARFGHLGMFNLQLDVASVSNLEISDNQSASKP
jgi:hypothetical protein